MATPKTGRWQVPTETSVYLLDLDARQVIRVPDAGTGTPMARRPTRRAAPRASLRAWRANATCSRHPPRRHPDTPHNHVRARPS